MKKIIHPILSLLCSGLILISGLVQAQEQDEEQMLSARELLAECEQSVSALEPNQFCMRFVFGMVTTADMMYQSGEAPKLFCIDPTLVSLQEVTGKVTRYLKESSERMQEDAYILVGEALRKNYPCPGQGV